MPSIALEQEFIAAAVTTALVILYLHASDRVGSRGGTIAPPKTYESNFIHHNFVRFGKQHSRYKAIFHPLFCHNSVVKYTSSLLQ